MASLRLNSQSSFLLPTRLGSALMSSRAFQDRCEAEEAQALDGVEVKKDLREMTDLGGS